MEALVDLCLGSILEAGIHSYQRPGADDILGPPPVIDGNLLDSFCLHHLVERGVIVEKVEVDIQLGS